MKWLDLSIIGIVIAVSWAISVIAFDLAGTAFF